MRLYEECSKYNVISHSSCENRVNILLKPHCHVKLRTAAEGTSCSFTDSATVYIALLRIHQNDWYKVCDIIRTGQMSERSVCSWVAKFKTGYEHLKDTTR